MIKFPVSRVGFSKGAEFAGDFFHRESLTDCPPVAQKISVRLFQRLPKRLPFPFICLNCPTAFEFMHLIDLNGMLAQATAPPATQPGTSGTQTTSSQALFGSPIIFFVLVFVMMYFIMIRPQQQRAKQQAKLIANLKSGDKVVTASGIIGVVTSVKERTVSLRSADAKMEVTKSSVTEILEGGNAAES
jgi:preprotein translocase subunit YajC